ncbi:MAG: MocA protein [Bacteroidetes bacterium]|nr:MocA protein [Bacteroidota bacterium]
MTQDFGVAIIGCGKWGINHVRTAHQLLGGRLKMVCDISDKSLAQAKTVAPSVSTTKTLNDILSDSAIAAVIIASGAETHLEIGKRCLEAGKHCLIEKPLTLKSGEALDLIETAEKSKLTVMVGHLLLYHPAVNRMRREIQSGDLGQLLYLYSQRVNLGTIRRQENAFWSLAPHDISVMLYLTDQFPVSVSAIGGKFISKNLPDVVFYHLEFESGLLAHGHVSWLDPHKMRKFTIVGSRKMMILDDMEPTGKLKIFDKGVGLEVGDGDLLSLPGVPEMQSHGSELIIRDGDIFIPKISHIEPLRIEQQHFFECVAKGEKPLTDGYNGLKVLQVMEAAQESLDKRGTPIEIKQMKYA